MRVHTTLLKTGIQRTKEFEKKGLAQFAVNVGTKCGHGCLYCSTGAMLRVHGSFKAAGENPFTSGYANVDADTPARVARDAKRSDSEALSSCALRSMRGLRKRTNTTWDGSVSKRFSRSPAGPCAYSQRTLPLFATSISLSVTGTAFWWD